MPWLKLYDDLRYDAAMLKATRIKREEIKLRNLGGNGNYASIDMRLSFDGPGYKRYAVWVLPMKAQEVSA